MDIFCKIKALKVSLKKQIMLCKIQCFAYFSGKNPLGKKYNFSLINNMPDSLRLNNR